MDDKIIKPPRPQAEPDMRKVCEALGFDPTNHHNAAKCPYCRGQQPQAEAVPDVVRDAERYRWLTEDHASLTAHAFVDQIAQRISIRGKEATDYAIDAAIAAQGTKP